MPNALKVNNIYFMIYIFQSICFFFFLNNVLPAVGIMEFKFHILHNNYLNLNIYCFISVTLYRFDYFISD